MVQAFGDTWELGAALLAGMVSDSVVAGAGLWSHWRMLQQPSLASGPILSWRACCSFILRAAHIAG